eukprot:TRINITY_DN55513_c0_g1_i1.p1 TRINITY_DN55513_c0_g1~~TRINITY_DN55513_c0_g1_i1.p1  ORF type:complete len:1037 (-),score=207.18 TRINITY_DN55513_c0_g1_i1:88-3198(-)
MRAAPKPRLASVASAPQLPLQNGAPPPRKNPGSPLRPAPARSGAGSARSVQSAGSNGASSATSQTSSARGVGARPAPRGSNAGQTRMKDLSKLGSVLSGEAPRPATPASPPSLPKPVNRQNGKQQRPTAVAKAVAQAAAVVAEATKPSVNRRAGATAPRTEPPSHAGREPSPTPSPTPMRRVQSAPGRDFETMAAKQLSGRATSSSPPRASTSATPTCDYFSSSGAASPESQGVRSHGAVVADLASLLQKQAFLEQQRAALQQDQDRLRLRAFSLQEQQPIATPVTAVAAHSPHDSLKSAFLAAADNQSARGKWGTLIDADEQPSTIPASPASSINRSAKAEHFGDDQIATEGHILHGTPQPCARSSPATLEGGQSEVARLKAMLRNAEETSEGLSRDLADKDKQFAIESREMLRLQRLCSESSAESADSMERARWAEREADELRAKLRSLEARALLPIGSLIPVPTVPEETEVVADLEAAISERDHRIASLQNELDAMGHALEASETRLQEQRRVTSESAQEAAQLRSALAQAEAMANDTKQLLDSVASVERLAEALWRPTNGFEGSPSIEEQGQLAAALSSAEDAVCRLRISARATEEGHLTAATATRAAAERLGAALEEAKTALGCAAGREPKGSSSYRSLDVSESCPETTGNAVMEEVQNLRNELYTKERQIIMQENMITATQRESNRLRKALAVAATNAFSAQSGRSGSHSPGAAGEQHVSFARKSQRNGLGGRRALSAGGTVADGHQGGEAAALMNALLQEYGRLGKLRSRVAEVEDGRRQAEQMDASRSPGRCSDALPQAQWAADYGQPPTVRTRRLSRFAAWSGDGSGSRSLSPHEKYDMPPERTPLRIALQGFAANSCGSSRSGSATSSRSFAAVHSGGRVGPVGSGSLSMAVGSGCVGSGPLGSGHLRSCGSCGSLGGSVASYGSRGAGLASPAGSSPSGNRSAILVEPPEVIDIQLQGAALPVRRRGGRSCSPPGHPGQHHGSPCSDLDGSSASGTSLSASREVSWHLGDSVVGNAADERHFPQR